MESFSYLLDEKLYIRKCSFNWDIFALENDGFEATKNKVIGKNFIDCLSGSEIIKFYMKIFEKLNKGLMVYEFDLECNSPKRERLFKCSIMKHGAGYLITNRLISEKEIKFEENKKYTYNKPLCKCSICNRYKIDDVWGGKDVIMRLENNKTSMLCITHTICPVCRIKNA